MANQTKQILWAVDPLSEPALSRACVRVLQRLSQKSYGSVLPVYLYNSVLLDIRHKNSAAAMEKFHQMAQKALNRTLQGSKIPGIQPLKVIPGDFATTREQAQELVRFAHHHRTALIVLSTRARKGLERWMLGSFAETLILTSDIPLLTINPSATSAPDFKNIVFPTDFSPESEEAFDEALEFAQTFGSKILLFHKLRLEVTPIFDLAFSGEPVYRDRISDLRSSALNQGRAWARRAEVSGVEVDVRVDSKPGSPTDAILAQAKKSNAIIALAAQSSPIAAALLGSTARSLVRASVHPVWVIHPQRKTKGRKLQKGAKK